MTHHNPVMRIRLLNVGENGTLKNPIIKRMMGARIAQFDGVSGLMFVIKLLKLIVKLASSYQIDLRIKLRFDAEIII